MPATTAPSPTLSTSQQANDNDSSPSHSMKLSTSRDALLPQLQTVPRVASTHTAVQALSGTQITAADGAVELRATDLEVGLRVPLEATVEQEGVAVLPARLLLDVVRALPADAVTLELRTAEQDVEITSG